MPPDRRAFTALKKYGLLLLNDPALSNLCRLVAGARVRGSWWAHPRAQEIFKVYDALEDHPDVLLLKLISRKVTYVNRPLWPQIVAIGRAREIWQTKDLSTAARKLLAAVDKVPVEPGRDKAAAAKELDARMLVLSAQFHSESVAHVLRLESSDHWSNRTHTPRHRLRRPRRSRSASSISIASSRATAGCHGKAGWNSHDAP